MTILFGILLLLSLFAIGRDGRVLPAHGICAAICVAVMGRGGPALTALLLLISLNLLAWLGLRRFAPYQPDDVSGVVSVRLRAAMAVVGAMALVLLTALSAMPGLPILLCSAVVLAGLCGAAMSVPLLQCVGLLCALNGLILLGGGTGNWMLIGAAAILWSGLAVLGFWLLPRLAWLRAEPVYGD